MIIRTEKWDFNKEYHVKSLFLLLRRCSVDADDDRVVPLVGLEGHLLLRLHLFCLHLLDLSGEDDLGLGGRVDAVGLDGDDEVAAVLQEVGGVDGDDASLKKSQKAFVIQLLQLKIESS